MIKLTDTQFIVLSKAAAREDGAASVPDHMNRGGAMKVGSSLKARKLMREIRLKPGMPVWREEPDGQCVSLIMTRAGRDAIEVEDRTSRKTKADPRAFETPVHTRKEESADVNLTLSNHLPRSGSKQALIVNMLSSTEGTTLDALMEATGWLPHSTRAAMTGLRKRGLNIERTRGAVEGSVYRIVSHQRASTSAGV